MDSAIGMMILAIVISTVGVIYFTIQDRRDAKRIEHAKLHQEPVNVSETMQDIAKEMKKITKKLSYISQKLEIEVNN